MPRPSRNLDRALLAAGRELFATSGCAGLSVREVAEAAGVNLGMFHYHFKSREAFLRALLQNVYEEMFARLTYEAAAEWGPVENLRAVLRFIGRFIRDNRPVLARVLADAVCGEPVALDFIRENFPRHLGLVQSLLDAAKEAGVVKPVATQQLLGFCAGSVGMSILFAGAAAQSGAMSRAGARALERAMLSDAAIDERVELALAAITLPAAAPKRRPAKRPT